MKCVICSMDLHALYQTITQYWLQITGIVTALVGVITGGIKIYKAYGVPFIALVKKHAELPEKIDTIYKEIRPNHGGSMKDAVTNLEKSFAKVEKRQLAQYMYNEHPIVETNIKGEVTWVNRSYLRMLNTTFEEVEGNGWKNFIHKDDRERIFREWEEAVNDKRDYKASFKFISSDGHEIPVFTSTLAMGKEGYISFITKGEKHLDRVL